MSERAKTAAKETGRERGTKRDTSRIKSRGESQRDTGRIMADAPRHRVAVFAPRLELDGITMYARSLISALRAGGSPVMLVSPGGPLAETLIGTWDEWFELPETGGLGFFRRRRLREALLEFEPDILHAVCADDSLPAVAMADFLGTPLALSIHGLKPEELPAVGDKRYDAFIASDQSVREKLLNECRIERDRATLIRASAFPERKPDKRYILDSRRRQVVGWVSPLTEGCGHRALIDAAIKVQARGVDCMFSILGAGPLAPEVRDEVDNRGMLPRIVVVQGLFDYGRIWDPFDVAVIDSRQKASALMVLNAMANGRPVIATEGGAVFDLIQDGVDGLIVPRDDADALAERVLMLVQNPDERLRMAEAAFKKIGDFYRPADMAYALNTVYHATLEGDALPKTFEKVRK